MNIFRGILPYIRRAFLLLREIAYYYMIWRRRYPDPIPGGLEWPDAPHPPGRPLNPTS